jgi:hypothetical protein
MTGYHTLAISEEVYNILKQRKETTGLSISGQVAFLVKNASISLEAGKQGASV